MLSVYAVHPNGHIMIFLEAEMAKSIDATVYALRSKRISRGKVVVKKRWSLYVGYRIDSRGKKKNEIFEKEILNYNVYVDVV